MNDTLNLSAYYLNESDGPMYYSNFNDVALELLEEGISRSDERIKKDINLFGVSFEPGSKWEEWELYYNKMLRKPIVSQ